MSIPASALIVDDEAHVRLFVRLLLGKVGIPLCFEATTLEQALSVLQTNRPGLVMLDVNMPGTDGLKMLAAIREIDEDAKVIILSGGSTAGTVVAAAGAGADGYIRKDTPGAEIVRQITEILTAEPEAGGTG